MEVKKVRPVLLFFICIPLLIFILSDNSQYKRIGDTNFYLLPDVVDGHESLLYHDGGSRHEVFYPIDHDGSVHDVYWNKEVLIVKCSQQKLEHWYLMRNLKDYAYSEFKIQHFFNKKDYQNALDSLGLRETDMEHVDGSIPWRIHF